MDLLADEVDNDDFDDFPFFDGDALISPVISSSSLLSSSFPVDDARPAIGFS